MLKTLLYQHGKSNSRPDVLILTDYSSEQTVCRWRRFVKIETYFKYIVLTLNLFAMNCPKTSFVIILYNKSQLPGFFFLYLSRLTIFSLNCYFTVFLECILLGQISQSEGLFEWDKKTKQKLDANCFFFACTAAGSCTYNMFLAGRACM